MNLVVKQGRQIIAGLFVGGGVPCMVNNLVVKSTMGIQSYQMLTNGKVGYREVESEGSQWLNPAPRNLNRISYDWWYKANLQVNVYYADIGD